MPLVSVIVPVYKAENFLRKCTDSILGQTMTDFELILVEDGSPDTSGALCDTIATEDPRVRVIHKPNGGVSTARNMGMAQATGKYIAFADSDDWFAPDMLKKLVDAAEENGADSAGCSHFNVLESGESWAEKPAMPAGIYEKDAIISGIVDPLVGDRLGKGGEVLNGFIWRYLFTRSIIADNNITFEGAYLEDEIFLVEYFLHAEKLAIVNDPLYYYLWNSASVTHRYMKDYMKTFTGFMDRKEKLVARFSLDQRRPMWRESSNWAGLLIAIGNEYAASNPASLKEKQKKVKEYVALPQMQQAISTLKPENQSRNKQIVSTLVRMKQFWLLSLLYSVKNR